MNILLVQDSVGMDKSRKLVTADITECLSKLM